MLLKSAVNCSGVMRTAQKNAKELNSLKKAQSEDTGENAKKG